MPSFLPRARAILPQIRPTCSTGTPDLSRDPGIGDPKVGTLDGGVEPPQQRSFEKLRDPEWARDLHIVPLSCRSPRGIDAIRSHAVSASSAFVSTVGRARAIASSKHG